MEFANLFFALMFTACIALGLHLNLAVAGNSKLFREYIGVYFRGVRFSDVPINDDVEFHFILSFAMDYTTTNLGNHPNDGQFNVFWDVDRLSNSAVADVKSRHSNVKVAMSLGWDTVNGVPAYFAAVEWVDAWVENAVASLLLIIEKYQIDGVDINYRRFNGTDPKIFAESVGKLVTRLKNLGAISFASIAPLEDPEIQRYYLALWKDYADVIDYVNFQFYWYPLSTNVSEFLRYYDQQSLNYRGGKVLAGFMSSQEEGLTPDDGFFTACRRLQSEEKLEGIFVWSADLSVNNDFKFEVQAQDLLAASSWSTHSM